MAGIYEAYSAFTAKLALIDSTITCHLGQQFQREEDAPPRVIWWPTAEPIQLAESQGSPSPTPVGNPRRLWVRRSAIEIHIWGANRDSNGAESYEGADIQATELLLDKVVRALWSMPTGGTFGVIRELSGRWENVEGALEKYGALYVLTATVMIPITRATDLTGTMTNIPVTMEIANPATGAVTTDFVMDNG